jgi:hypothetical protein
MGSVGQVVAGVLEPYVGRMVADTCVRATALSLGVPSDTLGAENLPAVEQNIRRLLAPIAPGATVDALIERIREEVL